MGLNERPRGPILDYGGTLVEELGFDGRAAHAWMLAQASHVPDGVTLDDVVERAQRVVAPLSRRRDELGIEIPWVPLTRLVYDRFAVRFDVPLAELEAGFWDASVLTRALPGARQALDRIHAIGIPMAVLSNAMFTSATIRHDLDKHGLADHLEFVMVSSDYVVRKPSHLGCEIAAVRLGLAPSDILFVGDRLDTDVAAARAAGMQTVWLMPPNARPSAESDLSVASWDELVRHLEAAQ
jgi:HAD superfamily hydrolase (TIGR01509 family)